MEKTARRDHRRITLVEVVVVGGTLVVLAAIATTVFNG